MTYSPSSWDRLSKSGWTTNLYLPYVNVTGPRELAYFPRNDLAIYLGCPSSNEYNVVKISFLPFNTIV